MHPSPKRACRSTGTHLLHPQLPRSGQTATQGHTTTPTKLWELDGNVRRRRVRSHLTQAAQWALGSDSGSKRRLSGSPCGKARLGRNPRKPLARIGTCIRAGRSRAKRRTASLADTAHADSSQSSAEQPERDTTSSDITNTLRFWWNRVLNM